MTDFARYYLRLSPAGLRTCLIGLVLACVAFGGDNPNKNLSRAEHALKSGDFQRAEQIYRELLAKDDQNIQARLGLSRTLLKERRLQDSFDHAARVIAIAGLAMIDYYENRTYPCIVGLRRAASIDPDEPDYVFNLGQAAARSERYKEAADAYERFLVVAPRTDDERRARIRGLIDFLRYLGQQGSLYSLEGPDRTLVTFESPDYRPVIKLRMNGSKQYFRFVLDTGSGMSVLSEETARKMGIKSVARGGLARVDRAPGAVRQDRGTTSLSGVAGSRANDQSRSGRYGAWSSMSPTNCGRR